MYFIITFVQTCTDRRVGVMILNHEKQTCVFYFSVRIVSFKQMCNNTGKD